jgi:type IV fimbrial biogenesis protein FimT
MNINHSKTGFTLLELLIVMVIVAITCSVGLPAYTYVVEKMRAEIVISRLYRAVQLTRSTAIKNNAVATICPSVDKQHCAETWRDGYLVFIDARADGQVDAEDKLIKYFPAVRGQGSLLWKSFPQRNYLQMTALGFTNNQNGTFYYTSASNMHKISLIVSKTGRLRFG